jgi:hypothetical protein
MYRQPYIATARTRSRRGRPMTGQLIPDAVRPYLARGGTYLGEDEQYYYWMQPGAGNELNGFFDNIGNMFTRMVKFTPKSFTPGNIYKGVVNTALTTVTGGLYQVLPKNIKNTVYNVGKIALPVVAGGVLAYTMGPAVMATLMPKLSAAAGLLSKGAGVIGGLFGKSAPSDIGPKDYGSITGESRPGVDVTGGMDKAVTIGGELMNLLGRLPQNKQAEVIQQLTPEDIAYMETYKQVPPRLKDYFDSMAQQTFNPPMAPSGAASLYDAYGPQPAPAPAQAGMLGGLDMNTILLIAVPAVFFLFTQKGGRR